MSEWLVIYNSHALYKTVTNYCVCNNRFLSNFSLHKCKIGLQQCPIQRYKKLETKKDYSVCLPIVVSALFQSNYRFFVV